MSWQVPQWWISWQGSRGPINTTTNELKTSIRFGLKQGNQLRIQTEANLFSNKASGSKTTPNKASGSRPL